jgi:hypothetical protein
VFGWFMLLQVRLLFSGTRLFSLFFLQVRLEELVVSTVRSQIDGLHLMTFPIFLAIWKCDRLLSGCDTSSDPIVSAQMSLRGSVDVSVDEDESSQSVASADLR